MAEPMNAPLERTDPRIPEAHVRTLRRHLGEEPSPEMLDAVADILEGNRRYWVVQVINTVREEALASGRSGSPRMAAHQFALVGVLRKAFQVSAGRNPSMRKRKNPAISLKGLFERDGGICQLGNHAITLEIASRDHIKPLGEGGRNIPENIQLACRPCNEAKGCGDA